MRLNGRRAIMEYLGFRSLKKCGHLTKEHSLPFRRDLEDPRRVYAMTEDLDRWDEQHTQKNGTE